jgi:integrase
LLTSRVQHWQTTGDHEPVSIWTTTQLARFLQHTRHDRLHALWHLIALRGLRRGQAVGLRWCDVDLDSRQLTITQSITGTGCQIVIGPPKSAAGRRTIALHRHTVRLLRAHAERQREAQQNAGPDFVDTGYNFISIGGQALRPSGVTYRFRKLGKAAGLPPVRFHDLRHGAASIAPSAGRRTKVRGQITGKNRRRRARVNARSHRHTAPRIGRSKARNAVPGRKEHHAPGKHP